MGDPKKPKKKYKAPKKMWDIQRVKKDRDLAKKYGLKKKEEIWRAETRLKEKRTSARKLLAMPLEERIKREKELIESLYKLGVLNQNASLDDVLGLTIENILERRLQTIVYRKGLSNTIKQARQLIVHRHIKLNNRINTIPGYLVKRSEENTIEYADKAMEAKIKQKQEVKANAK